MQKNAKKVLGWLLLIGTFPFLVYFGFYIKFQSNTPELIQKNLKFENLFRSTALKVDQFVSQNHRLPTNGEFKNLLSEEEGFLSLNSCAEPLPEELGPLPRNSFYLGLWRGEWCEYYTHWNQKTTLSFDINNYYPFRSKVLTWLFFILSWLVELLAINLIVKSSPISLPRV